MADVSEWQIVDDTGSPLVIPDGVISFEVRGEAKIPNYPVEGGSFEGYNKIMQPHDVRMSLVCTGQNTSTGGMTRAAFEAALQALKKSLSLCTIVTPDAAYARMNMVHFDYRREARAGAGLILAQCWFQEVRPSAVAPAPTAAPDGKKPVAVGQVSPTTPTAAQLAAVEKEPIQ